MHRKGFDPRPLFFQLSWKTILLSWLGVAVLMGIFILGVFQLSKIENLIHVESLFKWSLFFGAVIGGSIAYYFTQEIDEITEKVKTFMLLFIPILVFSPLYAIFFNQIGYHKDFEIKKYEIFEVEKIKTSRIGDTVEDERFEMFIFIFENDELEKIRIKDQKIEWKKNDYISLKVFTGRFGWKWISS